MVADLEGAQAGLLVELARAGFLDALARFEEAFDLVASADRSVKVSLLP